MDETQYCLKEVDLDLLEDSYSNYNYRSVVSIEEELSSHGIECRATEFCFGSADSNSRQYIPFRPDFAFKLICSNLVLARSRETRAQKALENERKRIHSKNKLCVFLVVCCIVSLIGVGYLYYSREDAYDDYAVLYGQAKDLQEELAEVSSDLSGEIAMRQVSENKLRKSENKLADVQRKLSLIENEYDFFHDHAVIVTANAGKKYHHYSCDHIAGRDFYIYNTELAKYKGYEPCADCFD